MYDSRRKRERSDNGEKSDYLFIGNIRIICHGDLYAIEKRTAAKRNGKGEYNSGN